MAAAWSSLAACPEALWLADAALFAAGGAAATSFLWQYSGLVGGRGARPAWRFLRGARYLVLGEREDLTIHEAARLVLQCPSLLWMRCYDSDIASVAALAALAAGAASVGALGPASAAGVVGVTYLSLVVAAEPFLNAQQDAHLVELCYLRWASGAIVGSPASFAGLTSWLALRHGIGLTTSGIRHARRLGLAAAEAGETILHADRPEEQLAYTALGVATLTADALVAPLILLGGERGRSMAAALAIGGAALSTLRGKTSAVSFLLVSAHSLPMASSATLRPLVAVLRALRLFPATGSMPERYVRAAEGVPPGLPSLTHAAVAAGYTLLSLPQLLRVLGIGQVSDLILQVQQTLARLRIANAYSRPAPRQAPRTEVAFELTWDGQIWHELQTDAARRPRYVGEHSDVGAGSSGVSDNSGGSGSGGSGGSDAQRESTNGDDGAAARASASSKPPLGLEALYALARVLHTPRFEWRLRQLAPSLRAIEALGGEDGLARVVPRCFWVTSLLTRLLEGGPSGPSSAWELFDEKCPVPGRSKHRSALLLPNRARRLALTLLGVVVQPVFEICAAVEKTTGWTAPNDVAKRLLKLPRATTQVHTRHLLKAQHKRLPIGARAVVYVCTPAGRDAWQRRLVAQYGEPIWRHAVVRHALGENT